MYGRQELRQCPEALKGAQPYPAVGAVAGSVQHGHPVPR
jgi:hypothetical protein